MEGRERKTPFISQTEPINNSHSHFSIPTHQHQPHKMMALKKAYADVILNTAKEAAVRVMASERRALRFQSELAASREEALQMLLRLKQMIDAKTAESEMTSLNQQRKVEELEAQLNEAEDVITDLRAELKHVCLKLENTKNSQISSLDVQSVTVKQVASFQDSAKSDTLALFPKKDLVCVTSCDVKSNSLTVNALDEKCCNLEKQTEQLRRSSLEHYYVHDSDFASLLMRSKEAELCKNGLTQRIHALEGNLLDEKLLTRDVHNQDFGKKDGLPKDIDGQVAKLNAPSAKTEKMEIKKHFKCHKRSKRNIFSYCRSCLLSSCKIRTNENCKSNKGVRSLSSIKSCAISKWKRKNRRHGHVGMVSSVFRSCKPSFVLRQCSSVSDNGKFCEDEYVVKTKLVPPLTDIQPMRGSSGVTESIQAVKKIELVKASEKDQELLNLEGCAVQNSTGPSSNMKVEIVNIPSANTDLEDAKAFEENHGALGQADDNRFLKYTFQRKRKMESLVNLDKKIDSEKRARRMKMEDKQNDALDPQKCA